MGCRMSTPIRPANERPLGKSGQVIAGKALIRSKFACKSAVPDRSPDRVSRNQSVALVPIYSWSARGSYQIVALTGRCYGFMYLVVKNMQRLPHRIALSLSMAALLVFLICLANGQTGTGQNAPLKIGYLMDSLKIERWQTDLDTFQKRAKELGAEVLVETAEGNDDLQLQQSQKLMDSGAKVLVLVPHDADKAARIVNAARARHVPVVCY